MFSNVKTLYSSQSSFIIAVLGFALLLVAFSASATAQSRDRLTDEYLKLKNKPSGLKGREGVKPALILLTESQRLEAGVAKVRFVIDGKLSRQDIHIQPLLIASNTDGEVSQITNAGDAITIRVGLSKSQPARETIANPEVSLPVDMNANALRIMIGILDGEQSDRQLIIPLTDEPEILGLRIFMPNGDGSSLTDGCDCPYVELTNSRCGTISKYCGSYVGNVLDGTNCTITCGSQCTNTKCTIPVGNDN